MSSVVLINPKYTHNLAAAIRACSCFGIKELRYTGTRMEINDKERLPREERMKGYSEVIWKHSMFPLKEFEGTPVCVELLEDSEPLWNFQHPEDAIYIFGPEDGSVPPVYRRHCHRFVHIPAYHCLNLAAAMNVLLADRFRKEYPSAHINDVLKETRGELAIAGWEGQ